LRTSPGVARSASSVRPTPSASQRAAQKGWSAPIGIVTSGMPCASAPMTVPEPPWQTTALQRGRIAA
jgi:hypothetical protein